MSTQIKTGIGRISYPAVFVPKAIKGSTELKYSVAFLIPKSDKEQIAMIQAAIDEAWEAGRAKGYFTAAKIPKAKNPLKDGDAMVDDEGEEKIDANYAGHMYFNAYAKNKPGLIDRHKDANGNAVPITNPDLFYPGCFARLAVNFYAFGEGKKGVAVGLNNIQKLKEGPRLDGRRSAEADFDDNYADQFADDDEDYIVPSKPADKPKQKPNFDPNDL